MRNVLWIALVAACGTKHDAPPVKPVTTSPPPAPAGGFPAIEAACATDDDCTTTGRWSTCCGVCEQKYASKAYVAKVEAYCTANPPEQCPPMGCSWGMAKVGCVDGVCREHARTPRIRPTP